MSKHLVTAAAGAVLLAFLVASASAVAHTKPLPSLVPSGWTLEARDKEASVLASSSTTNRCTFCGKYFPLSKLSHAWLNLMAEDRSIPFTEMFSQSNDDQER